MIHAPGIGFDLVEVGRIRALLGRREGFFRRVFTEAERTFCMARADPAPHFAARFAVKEAVAKALGCGIGAGAAWLDIETTREEGMAPWVVLHRAAAKTAAAAGITGFTLSMSHTRDTAGAVVLAVRR